VACVVRVGVQSLDEVKYREKRTLSSASFVAIAPPAASPVTAARCRIVRRETDGR
jgi:hypothetical protein